MPLAHIQLKEEIADVLSPYAAGHDDRRLIELLAVSVGRVLLNDAMRERAWQSQVNDEKLRHIADWLKAAVVNNNSWLDNVDDRGRPKKLMKFGSIEQIVREADKAMLKASRLSAVRLVEGDEEYFWELGEGFHIVRLLTPAALDRESAEMQHCIGNGRYDQNLERGDYTYLSLRDGAGKAHATIEIYDGMIVQIQGKQNRPAIKTYLGRLAPFVRAMSYSVAVPESHLGHVIDINGQWHDIHSLPEGLRVAGSLDLSNTNISALPKGLVVDGSILLSNTKIAALPEDLKIGKDVDLSGTGVTVLPEGFNVINGFLSLFNSGITALPEGLVVNKSLDLGRTSITSLPERLSVSRDLHLSFTNLRELPKDLKVGGAIYIIGTAITVMPETIADGTAVNCDQGWMTAARFRELHSKPSVGAPKLTLEGHRR